MTDELLPFYNQELSFIRTLGEQFAREHPKIAGRLRLGADTKQDPHVERMIQAFAFLNSRIRHKLDDDFPEITDALLGILYPHYQQPIPSMSILQFHFDRGQADLTAGHEIAARTRVESEPVEGQSCHFETVYPVRIWPMETLSVELAGRPFTAPATAKSAAAAAVLHLELATFTADVPMSKFGMNSLRFYLHASPGQNVWPLYELLLNDTLEVALCGDDPREDPVVLPRSCIQPVGFGLDEGMFPYSARSFPGFRLLSEFFSFPKKFLFFDVTKLDPRRLVKFRDKLHLYVYLDRTITELERSVTQETVRLGCTPIVNLFSHRADPFILTQKSTEYPLVLDARNPDALEVYSIESVTASSPMGDTVNYEPFYSFKHAIDRREQKTFWNMTRRPSAEGGHSDDEADGGTDALLSFLDLGFSTLAPADWTVDVQTTCLNRDLPARLPFGADRPEMNLPDGRGPISKILCLTPPTKTLRPPRKRRALWRVISQLSLNHLSIAEGDEAVDALREILKLYNLVNSEENRAMIEGIRSVSSRRVVGRVGGARGGFCRGIEVTIELDDANFSGSGSYLFACVLEQFIGLYASINSFSMLVVQCAQRGGKTEIWRWPLRTGSRIVL